MDALRDMLDKRAFDDLSVVSQRYRLHEDTGAEDVDNWLTSLTTILPRLDRTERRHLIELFGDIPTPRLAMSICHAVDHLPLNEPAVLRQWIAPAIARAPLNVEAAAAFLSLESASAQERLEKLLGQVRFDDCRRLFQLYAEGMIGQKLGVEPVPGWADNFRELPRTDGRTVYLPEMVGKYETSADNFRWYKVSLLHQLGYYEFGTFSNPDLVYADYFAEFPNPRLAASLFQILEDARIDWTLERRYRGAAVDIRRLKADALTTRDADAAVTDHSRLLEAMVQYSLDGNDFDFAGAELADVISGLFSEMSRLKYDAGLADTLNVLVRCYELIAPYLSQQGEIDQPEEDSAREEIPSLEAVSFRGKLDAGSVSINLAMIEADEADAVADGEEPPLPGSSLDADSVDVQQFKRGAVNQEGIVLTEADAPVGPAEKTEEPVEDEAGSMKERLEYTSEPPVEERTWQYDEWDYLIDDYRRRWCTLFEIRESEDRPEFVDDTLREHHSVALRVRRQLNMLKPELLRKVKGVIDGEELDLERAVEAVVDRRAGFTPGERIYIQRQRKERDVSALFLLDMSASTDDAIPDAEAEEKVTEEQLPRDEDDFLTPFDTRFAPSEMTGPVQRIIDVEKQAVVLMAEALKDLGDSYSICGFSGYGRERVDFFLCKDFDEPFNQRVKGRIGGIKPCRSTRMGPAIRHATYNLCQTGSKIQALIIISDGYPQDFDYGKDRNSKEYGIRDTTRALAEARQKGVQTFCLTVDPSGHDYLREMCPDQQYMVIQEISQLPNELSKVYRALTG